MVGLLLIIISVDFGQSVGSWKVVKADDSSQWLLIGVVLWGIGLSTLPRGLYLSMDLRFLAKLKAKGVISEDECQRRKRVLEGIFDKSPIYAFLKHVERLQHPEVPVPAINRMRSILKEYKG